MLQRDITSAIRALYPDDHEHQKVLFQQDSAPPHYKRTVQNYLNETFPNRWVGHGGPYKRPPRLPDLSPLDFAVWGIIKRQGVCQKSTDPGATETAHSRGICQTGWGQRSLHSDLSYHPQTGWNMPQSRGETLWKSALMHIRMKNGAIKVTAALYM